MLFDWYNGLSLAWLVPLMIWELVWKGMGLWHSARNKHLPWFLCILIFNTLGVLPIIYLIVFQKKSAAHASTAAKKRRR